MEIKHAEFVISVADSNKILGEGIKEIAIAGKSNVGKSSFINFVTNNGKLAKTSKLPGRTRLINYFSINKDSFYFVDLPGYGFAKVSDEEKAKWGRLIEDYLQNSTSLKNLFLLLDIRHEPTKDDMLMIGYLNHYNISYTVIATKADKLPRSQVARRRQDLANLLKIGRENVYVVSSYKKEGKDAILARIEEILA